MEISWLGHSCLRIRSNEVTLITDPYGDSLGISLGRQKADIVTVSHSHPNHSGYHAIEGGPRVLKSPGEYEIADFYITGMGTERNDPEGERQVNTVFTIRCEGVTLCHLGDLNRMLSPRQIEELSQMDVLFVPAGGVCTISPSRVAELINLVAPKIVVPVHYRTDGVLTEMQPLDVFLADMGITDPGRSSRLNVTASNLPKDLRLVVLDRVS
jgi:L-ascorbate metabolism protein UlaG (beta-lactamase superfamily)